MLKNCLPKESGEGDDTVLRGSVKAPEGFSEGKPEAAKPRGRLPILYPCGIIFSHSVSVGEFQHQQSSTNIPALLSAQAAVL